VAFVDDPVVSALFDQIMELDRAIDFAAYVDPDWRGIWKEYVKRWRAEFAAYDTLGDKLDPKEGRARLDRFADVWLRFKSHWEGGVVSTRPKPGKPSTPAKLEPADRATSSASGFGVLVLLALIAVGASR
jgi:hypothetical protein